MPEPIGTTALGALIPPAKVLEEPGPVVEERVTPPPPVADRAGSTTRVVSPSEAAAIQAVLGRYRTAFSHLDAGAASAVWPSVDIKALRRAFERLERQDLVFNSCHIAIVDARAVASCGGTARYVPRVGKRSERDERRQWEFQLHKVDDTWLIDAVSAR